MGSLSRKFESSFTFGLIRCLLVFEGPFAEKYPEMLDNIHRNVSKFVYQVFFPKIEQGAQMFEPSPGETKLHEVVKVELLDHSFTLEVELDLNIKDVIPEIALRAMVVETIVAGVMEDAIPRFAHRMFAENTNDQIHALLEQKLAQLSVEGGGARTGILESLRSLGSHAGVGIPFPMPIRD